jgi:segregation and condensation protein B
MTENDASIAADESVTPELVTADVVAATDTDGASEGGVQGDTETPSAHEKASTGDEVANTTAAPTPRKRRKAALPEQPTLFEIAVDDPELPASSMPFENRVEATILLADRPISDARIAEVLGLVPPSVRASKDAGRDGDDGRATEPDANSEDSAALAGRRREAIRLVREACDALNAHYAATNRSFRIESVSGGRQVLTVASYGPVLARLKGQRAQTRLSQAALETLAIIAYRQPLLRAQLEAIRGVACGEVLKSLMERRLVKIVGRSEEVGRPMLYGTTPEFLRVFGIANLSDLPQAKDLR